MANSDAAFGLRPMRTIQVNPYYIASSYGTALYIGDPVIITGTSNTAAVSVPGVGDMGPGTLPEINKATAGDANFISGVIVGFAPLMSDLSKQYNPASTARVAFVADHPDQTYEIQADGAVAATAVGLNAVLIYTNSGSTTTGLSGVELDTSSDAPAADASNQLTILRVIPRLDNEAGSAWTKCEVRINQHTNSDNVIGI